MLISQAICKQCSLDNVSGCFINCYHAVYFSGQSFPRMFKIWNTKGKNNTAISHIVGAQWELT